ncbi:Hypothetical predicted protein [Olea europaea subsp. europaea]|uniref:Uncharacterized protein n=1 Tax=Olea europaea subsp. europaea TaxID=158383 RepID=A0A8S0V1X7_OLEEU|nr:Hypothetical predicted protein [Olea europaea subsp. europaea]
MPENQAASLTWPGRVSVKACTPYPKNCLEVPDVSLQYPRHGLHTVSQKPPRNAWKPDCIPAVAKMHPEHFLHTMFQKQPKNTSKSGCVPAASSTCLARRVPETAHNCLKIRLHPYCGHDASQTWPGHRVPENTKKCLKIGLLPTATRTHPGYGLHTMPTNCIQMPENQATFLPRSGHVPYMACISCPKTSQKSLKIRLHPCRRPKASRLWPTHHVPEIAKKCLKIKLHP